MNASIEVTFCGRRFTPREVELMRVVARDYAGLGDLVNRQTRTRPHPGRDERSPGYRKLFAPVIPGLTDTVPICAAYERMRQADMTQQTILLFVECQTMGEFREALGRLPIRKSSEWRSFDNGH